MSVFGRRDARPIANLYPTMVSELKAKIIEQGSKSTSAIPDTLNEDELYNFLLWHVYPKKDFPRFPISCETESWGLRLSVPFSLGYQQAEIAGKALRVFGLLARIIHTQRSMEAIGIEEQQLNAYTTNQEWVAFDQAIASHTKGLLYKGNTYACVKTELDMIELRLAWNDATLPSFKDSVSETIENRRSRYQGNRKQATVVQQTTDNIVANQPQASTEDVPV